MEVVDEQQHECRDHCRERQHEQAATLEPDGARALEWLPGREGGDQRGGRSHERLPHGCLWCGYQQTNPPSTIRSTPVQKLAASLSKKTAGPTISAGSAIRPIGVSASKRLTCSATSGRVFIGVAV